MENKSKKKKSKPDDESGEDSATPDPTVRKRKKKEKDAVVPDTELEKSPDKGKQKKDKEEYGQDHNPPGYDTPVESEPTKKPPIYFITREFGKHVLPREKFLMIAFVEMVLYLGFLLVIGIFLALQRSGDEYYLTRVMTKLFIDREFRVFDTGEVLSFNEVNTAEQVLSYLRFLFVSWTDWTYLYSFEDKWAASGLANNPMIFYDNRYIGTIRIKQVRVKEKTCKIPDLMKSLTPICIASYSSGDEYKGNLQIPEDTKNTTARVTTPFIYSSASKLGSGSTSGEVSTYGGGGYYRDLYGADPSVNNDTIKEELFNNTWIKLHTRAVLLQFTTYNANVNIFFTMKLLFEFPSTGGVIPTYTVYPEKFLRRGILDYIDLLLFVIFIISTVIYTISELYEILYFRLHYFDYFWNFYDLLVLIMCYVAIALFAYMFAVIHFNIKDLLKTGEKKHASFDTLNNARETFIAFFSILFFFAAFKLLKYMHFNHSMYQMQMTLSKATKDIACFSIMFFIVFITFAQLGHLLFGSQVRDFRTFIHSIFALLRTAVGDFDYHKIENVNHFLGPVFFFAYIFFIYFILVNMFLAIIIDTYSEVRTALRDQTKDLQMCDVICKKIRGLFGKKDEKKGPAEPQAGEPSPHLDMQNLLRRCGFTEMEIDLFFAKFEIPKDKAIPKEEMRQKLLTNFNMQPELEQIKAQEAKEKDEIGEKLMDRIKLLENNISDVNNKIDLIDSKIDAIQQLRARKLGQQDQK